MVEGREKKDKSPPPLSSGSTFMTYFRYVCSTQTLSPTHEPHGMTFTGKPTIWDYLKTLSAAPIALRHVNQFKLTEVRRWSANHPQGGKHVKENK